ncbi:MAG: nucleoside-diphosphate sugar epimerase, partial [Qipengyuania vulgaris]
GTTWKKAGEDEETFRAVDQHLVLDTAKAALENGVDRFVMVSSVGADAASKNFYLKVKGETERELTRLRFNRLDIMRPGLLVGDRDNDRRTAERLGIIASPFANLFMHGRFRQYRGIKADLVAKGAIALAKRAARGRFVHDNDAILRAANSLPALVDS